MPIWMRRVSRRATSRSARKAALAQRHLRPAGFVEQAVELVADRVSAAG
jgi:hypothetical protein